MLTHIHRKALIASLTLLLGGMILVASAADVRLARDLGTSYAAQRVDVTLVLKLHHPAALEDFVYRTVTPGNPDFHQFLTTGQFAERYGATDGEIARVRAFLQRSGIDRIEVMPNRLAIRASGTIAQFNAAFQTSVHDFQRKDGRRFHRPDRQPTMPLTLGDLVVATAGLDNEPHYRPHNLRSTTAALPASRAEVQARLDATNSIATNTPGEYTVGDVAKFYHINPLYRNGITGKGSTVGIVTLAGFDPQDAYDYWRLIRLPTKPHRITQVHVDGGGELSAAAGSGETALDVEQSGGLAPRANIRVYDAPNTDAGFIDAFYTAVSDNIADSISVSWGQPEIFYFDSPLTGADHTGELLAFHQVFLEAAAQGISMFAASGDSGAFDTARFLAPPLYSTPLTVDAPAADPFITAAGGTTRPFSYSFEGGPVESITQESVWGWTYLQNYLDIVAYGKYDLFSVGGGGGVSVFWNAPTYQQGAPGVILSIPHQSLVYYGGAAPVTLLLVTGRFAGRNLPDIALNADPFTGYLLLSSIDDPANPLLAGYGGTSFVAPQLSGINALLKQSTGRRIGFWNPQIYALQGLVGYGSHSAFNDIVAGDNWFFEGMPGYDQGAGIGTLAVKNFAVFLRHGF